HIDFNAGTIHRPKPKGGVDRAFTVPLSTIALSILKHRQKRNGRDFPKASPFAFPAWSNSGHISEPKEQRVRGGQKVKELPSPHRLRDTFATIAHEVGIDPITLKCLLNHSLPGGDVTAGYIRPSLETMRTAVQRIANRISSLLGNKRFSNESLPLT